MNAIPAIPVLKLNDGHSIPQLGLGVWQMSDGEAETAIKAATIAGYRLIDTAAIYGNEAGVGEGVRNSGVEREELFITTKLWNDQQARESARRALRASLERLRLKSVDLYLIHWPAPSRGLFLEAWKALIELKQEGLTRSIGVSNFNADHLERIIGETGVTPAVNQIELHPYLQQRSLRELHARLGIVTQAWSPLGQGQVLRNPTLTAMAKRLNRTSAQVILRWHQHLGVSAIPKSVRAQRIQENRDCLGFTLGSDDLVAIESLDRGGRVGPDPATFG